MKWITLGLLAIAGTATAQTAVTPRSVQTAFGPAVRYEPAISPGAFPQLRGEETPTTLRQRAARAEMVFARYPDLRAQVAGMPSGLAAATLASAERKARWELIREREARR